MKHDQNDSNTAMTFMLLVGVLLGLFLGYAVAKLSSVPAHATPQKPGVVATFENVRLPVQGSSPHLQGN